MIQHFIDGLLFFEGGRDLHVLAWDVGRTSAHVHSDGLGLLPTHFYITFDDFARLESADWRGGGVTILVSFSKVGLISRQAFQARAIRPAENNP
jgi:hypothetical protein